MNGPGKILEQARKKKRYSIERIHKTIKIKKEYIDGLENDNISAFPAEVYYKNFLKTYSIFLGLNPNEMLNLYEKSKLEQQEDLFKQVDNKIENKFVEFYKKNKQIFIYSLYGIIITVVICIIIILIPNKNFFKQNNILSKNKIEVISLSSNTNTNTITTPTIITNKIKNEQKLFIKASSDTWIKIIGDNKKLFESILAKDKTFEANAEQEFNIKIGNIDGVEVYFNDKPVDISKGASNSKVNTITLKRE